MTTDSEHEAAVQDAVAEIEGKPKMGSKKAIDAKRGVNTFAVDPDDLIIIGRDTQHRFGDHALFQDRALEEFDEGLVQDMMARGFMSVIDVRKDGPTLEVVAGRRRVIAAREAKKRLGTSKTLLVQCKVFRGTNSDASLWLLGENANRKERGLLGLAQDCQNSLNFGATDEETARACGKTVAYMRTMLTLLDLAPPIQAAVRSGKVSSNAGFQLAKLTRDEQLVELGKIEAGVYVPTAKAISGAVKTIRTGETAIAAPNKAVLKKIVAHEDAERVLGEDGLLALKWMLGLTKPRTIAGLSDLIRKVSE